MKSHTGHLGAEVVAVDPRNALHPGAGRSCFRRLAVGCTAQGVGFRVSDLRFFKVWGFWFQIFYLGFRFWGLVYGVWGLSFGGWGWGVGFEGWVLYQPGLT